MKQTAVEWLVEEIKHIIPSDFLNKFNQAREIEKQQQGYSEEEVTILLQNIINEIEIRKQNIISKSETISVHLLEGGCMAFESSQDVVKEQVKQFKNK